MNLRTLLRSLAVLGLLFIIPAATGCVAARGSPSYPGGTAGEMAQLKRLKEAYFDVNVLQVPAGRDPTAWRNEVIDGRILAFDIQYRDFENRITGEFVLGNVGTDWAVLAVNTAGVFVGGAETKTVLHGISALIVGGKASIDRNVYYDKTLPALRAQMIAGRSEVLAEIRRKQLDPAYTIAAAVEDTDAYYRAGTLPGAIDAIVRQSGNAAAVAQSQLKEIPLASSDEATKYAAIREQFNTLYNAATTGSDAQKHKDAVDKAKAILTKLGAPANAAASTQDVFNALNDEIKKGVTDAAQRTKVIDAFNQ